MQAYIVRRHYCWCRTPPLLLPCNIRFYAADKSLTW
jgi:hypothetical protein